MTTKSAFQVSTTEMEIADNQGQKEVTQARVMLASWQLSKMKGKA